MMALGRYGLIVSAPWVAPMHRWVMYKHKKNLLTPRPGCAGFASHTLVLDQALGHFHPSLHRHLKSRAPAVGHRVDLALASLHNFGMGRHISPLLKFSEHRIDRALCGRTTAIRRPCHRPGDFVAVHRPCLQYTQNEK